MMLTNEIDEISMYKNTDGSYQVNIFTSGEKKIELPCVLLDMNISLDSYGEIEYNLTFKGANYARF